MSPILLLMGNFFVLIIALMGMQSCYFKAKWRWFWLMLFCALASAMCITIVVRQMLAPSPSDIQVYIRQPTTPL